MKKIAPIILLVTSLSCIVSAQVPVTAGLSLHLDAANGYNDNGLSPAVWTDLSGLGNDVTSLNATTAEPNWVANVGGTGFAGIQFDGIDDVMTQVSNSTNGFNNPFATIFIVRIANTAYNTLNGPFNNQWNEMVVIGQDNTFNNAFALAANWAIHSTLSGNWVNRDHPCYPELSDCLPAVLTGVFRTGISNGDLEYYVNDNISTNAPVTEGNPTPFTPASRGIAIGASWGSTPGMIEPNTFFQGAILEVLAYDEVLSDAEVNLVNQYLINRYSIQFNACVSSPSIIPIAYYNFSGGSTNDMTGNGHNGVQTPGTGPTSDMNGSPNCAYEFPGLPNEYIYVQSSTDFDFANQPATISVWYKPEETDPGKFELLVGRDLGLHCPNMSGDYSLALYDCRRPVGGINLSDNWHSPMLSGCSDDYVNLGWQHALVVFDWGPNGTIQPVRIYWNGNLTNSLPSKPGGCNPPIVPTTNSGDIYIGADFKGKIDDVRIYNGALSNTEAIALYENGVTPCCTPPGPSPMSYNTQLKIDKLNPKAYPNPFRDVITVEIPDQFIGGRLLLYNVLGEVIYSNQIISPRHSINAKLVPAGIYKIECITGKERSMLKIVKF